MLQNGHDAPRKRAKGSEKKWIVRGNKTYNVVIAKSHNFFYNEEVYVITHVGKFGG